MRDKRKSLFISRGNLAGILNGRGIDFYNICFRLEVIIKFYVPGTGFFV